MNIDLLVKRLIDEFLIVLRPSIDVNDDTVLQLKHTLLLNLPHLISVANSCLTPPSPLIIPNKSSITGYSLFQNIIKQQINSNLLPKPTDLTRFISEKWDSLSSQQKSFYQLISHSH